jgi:rhamnosyltransferase subunit B
MTRGTYGDLFPFVRLGRELKVRNHNVLLLTNCHYEDKVKRSGIDFAALDSPDDFARMLEDQELLNNPRDLALFYRRHILPRVVTEYEMIKKQNSSGDLVLVSNHNSHLTTQIAAEKLGIPLLTVLLAPTGITYMLPVFEGLFAVLENKVNRIRAEVGLPPVHDWGNWLGSVEQIVGLWPDWFAASEPGWPKGVTPVGFLLGDESREGYDKEIEKVQDMLDDEASPILITHGTSVPTDARFFAVGVEACLLLGRRGILVTQHCEAVPSPLPEGVKWVRYLPFASLMPRMGAVIHHGGIGTASRALAAAIPQLVLPDGFDRPDNAVRLRRLGVADYLMPHQWEPGLMSEMLLGLISPGVLARCRELAQRMRAANPAVAACEVIEQFVASKSPRPATASGIDQGSPLEQKGQGVETSRLIERLGGLSPEKRALLVQQLGKKPTQN